MKTNRTKHYKIPYETDRGKEMNIIIKPIGSIDPYQNGPIKWTIETGNIKYVVKQEDYNDDLNWGDDNSIPELFKKYKVEIEEQIDEYINDFTD